MTPQDYDDETLMAYADGALDPEAAKRVAAAAAADPAVAARIAMFRETGRLLGALGAARPDPPLPADLADRVERTLADARAEARVVPHPAARHAWRPAAIAAAIAFVTGALGGIAVTLALRDPGTMAPSLALLDAPGVRDALDGLPAGARGPAGDGAVRIVSSFLDADGAFCREFELERTGGDRVVSVACRQNGTWAARFAVVAETSGGTGYAPASALATLDTYLATIGAGPPLAPEEEAPRLASPD
jgi:hypothetical protein